MPASEMAALLPYGWSERVRALWNELDAATLPSTARPGRVLRIERGACEVADASGRTGLLPGSGAVAVGDWVAVAGERVAHVLPRWSALARMDPAQTGSQIGVQVLAANVDVVMVTAPADRLHVNRVEREVALAWESGARPLVVLTKGDLDNGTGLAGLQSRLVGVDVVATSARRQEGLERLREVLSPGTTGVLLGPSGAGKSTLVNALVGEEVLRTGDTREGDARGRHTTTSRRLICLPWGGTLIDMPGLRSLGMTGSSHLGSAFTDIDQLARGCRFRDCGHAAEPGCAVRRAIGEGRLDPARLASFKKLERELARERRRSDPLAAREARRAFYRMVKDTRRHDKRKPW